MSSLTKMIHLYRILRLHQTAITKVRPSRCSDINFCEGSVTNSGNSSRGGINPDIRKWRWSSLFLFLPGTITFGLGTWQLFRRQEKIEQVEYRKQRLDMEPINMNTSSSQLLGDSDPSSLEFRRVICEGVFDESKSIFVGPRSRSISGIMESGYYVLTPLVLAKEPGSQLCWSTEDGFHVVGKTSLEDSATVREAPNVTTKDVAEIKHHPWWKFWSKQPPVSENDEHTGVPHEEVTVHAVVRGSENPTIFVPANDRSTGQ